MAKPHIVLFHETLHRIVCARGLVGERAEKARTAIGRYVRALKRAAGFGLDEASTNRTMMEDELIELESKLQQWKLLGSDTALVCEAALATIRRERVENLCDRRIRDILPQLGGMRNSHAGGLVAK